MSLCFNMCEFALTSQNFNSTIYLDTLISYYTHGPEALSSTTKFDIFLTSPQKCKSCVFLTLVLLNPDIPCFANSVDPDQLASEEANWSGSALFAIKYANL